MRWLKPTEAFLAWIGAHAAAGTLLFVVIVEVPLFGSQWTVLEVGLAAGILFGLGQWFVLRWFLPQVRWWLPVTVALSPVSWYAGMLFAIGTLTFGGWLGGWISASAQMVLLYVPFQRRRHVGWLVAAWFVAAIIGSLLFYYGFLFAITFSRYNPPPLQSLLVGSVGFGVLTGIVIALFVRFASQPNERGAVVSRT